jgi:hypothetical protein
MSMLIQSSHCHADRGLDPYFACPEAVHSLLRLEERHLLFRVWEPAAGDGAISKILMTAGCDVLSTDIADYGWDGCRSGVDYLRTACVDGIGTIITNPPFRLAVQFAEKALREVGYVALLLRTNFLESTSRLPFFRRHPPTRIWLSSRRLPMMHRHGWTGPQAPSNTWHAWFFWQRGAEREALQWFDWEDYVGKDGTARRGRIGDMAANQPYRRKSNA